MLLVVTVLASTVVPYNQQLHHHDRPVRRACSSQCHGTCLLGFAKHATECRPVSATVHAIPALQHMHFPLSSKSLHVHGIPLIVHLCYPSIRVSQFQAQSCKHTLSCACSSGSLGFAPISRYRYPLGYTFIVSSLITVRQHSVLPSSLALVDSVPSALRPRGC